MVIGVGVALIALISLYLYRSRTPEVSDLPALAAVEAQVYLQDVEVAVRLAVLKTWLQDRRDPEEIAPLYTVVADSLRNSHSALAPGSHAQTWLALEPMVTRLGVQVANGDPEAVATIDDLLATLSGTDFENP